MTYKTEPTLRQQKRAVRSWAMKKSARVVLCAITLCFGFLYVLEVNTMSSRGYEMSDLQKKIDALDSENRRLQVDIANYRSMTSIQERVAKLDLVAATDASYGTIDSAVVARR